MPDAYALSLDCLMVILPTVELLQPSMLSDHDAMFVDIFDIHQRGHSALTVEAGTVINRAACPCTGAVLS